MSDLTTIAVSSGVKRALAERGRAGESYNTVLKRLLNVQNEERSQAGQVGPHNQRAIDTSNLGEPDA